MTIKHLYILLKLLPDKDWSEFDLSNNISLSSKPHLLQHIPTSFDTHKMIYSCIIDRSLLHKKLAAEYWNLRIDFIREFKDDLKWKILSFNSSITCSIIENNLDLPWSWLYIIDNPNITREFMNKYSDKIYKQSFVNIERRYELLKHRCLDFNTLMKYITANMIDKFDMGYIVRNKNFTYDVYKKYFDNKVPLEQLVDSQFITLLITDDIIYKLDWNRISDNKSITEEYVKAHMEYPWKWYKLTSNHNISFNFIKNNMDKGWNIDELADGINNNITFDTIKNNPEFPWNKYGTSANENLTARIVLENPNGPWNWVAMSSNTFSTDHEVDHIRDLMNKYIFKWRYITRKNKKYKRDLFIHTLDMLTLRIRDINNGIRATMI